MEFAKRKMINHSDKYIFVAVPKTGSSTINSILAGHTPKPHLDIMEIKESVSDDIFSEYFKFGFVRNPWDRAVSLYHRQEGIQLRDRMSFEEFIDYHNYATDTCIHPTQKKHQLDFFTNKSGNVIVDFIGRFENLQQDFNVICDKIGIPIQELPHVNKSQHKHYIEYYTEKTRQIVAKKYAKDIEYFGYEFQ